MLNLSLPKLQKKHDIEAVFLEGLYKYNTASKRIK